VLLSADRAVISYSGHLKQALTKALQYTSFWILSIKKATNFCYFKKKLCFNRSVLSTYPFTKCVVGPAVSSPCKAEKKGMILCGF